MDIKLYTPDVRLTLYKTIGRTTVDGKTPVSQRVLDTHKTIDLTPFLGESGQLVCSKSVRESAGAFTLVLADAPYSEPGAFESLYGLIEPMDLVEIRMRHNLPNSSSSSPSPTPPIYMRGFVTWIERDEAMGQDGKAQRSVTVKGIDYGVLWQMLQISFTTGYVIGESYLSSFKLFERFGPGYKTSQTAAEFVEQVMSAIVTPFLQSLMPANTSNPNSIKTDITVANGVVDVGGVQNQQGAIYNLLSYFGDVGMWNELYLEDREDGVYCVYRPNPFTDINGNVIQSDAAELTPISVHARDVLSLSLSRTHERVANYYWVRAPKFEMVDDIYRQQFALQKADDPSVILYQYPNSAAQFYGVRRMDCETQQGGNDVTTMSSGQPESVQETRRVSMTEWITNRREIVVAQNKDNVLLESGTARIRADERVKPGSYVRIVRGSFTAVYYVPMVDLHFVPYQGLFQTLHLERGTGFIERMKAGAGAQSPYLAEMADATA
ncbi:hypothetical protein AB4Y32_24100 [Paraburkholderia phymatum]|uniref:Uncharacterized protein n=1 Tax=Paraburkholderia phymatum TaxID=148447 RepID=A0ACC6U549_9BURK